MNAKVRKQLKNRKQRITSRLERLDRRAAGRPELAATNIHYEIADRARAITTGGIGAVHLLVKRLGLDRAIDDRLGLLKVHLPYHESDHVLNIAYNLLARRIMPVLGKDVRRIMPVLGKEGSTKDHACPRQG